MMDDLLPVGSVVLLKGGVKKLVIMGIKQASTDKPEEEFDYVGVLYPEGYLGNETLFLFNHGDISDIIFRGYTNYEREECVETVKGLYAEENEND